MRFFRWLKSIIRGYFFAGLLVIVPLGITFFVISAILKLMDRALVIIPSKFHFHTSLPFKIPGLGLILFIALVLITGILVKNYFGRRVIDLGEYILSKIPLVRPIYVATKQVIQATFGDSQDAFKRVVLIEYPRKDIYGLAFVTGVAKGELAQKTDQRMINVFVPTTPNPTSGFYLIVPEEDTIPLSITVEEAFKLLISGGVVEPGGGSPHFPFGKRARDERNSKRTAQGEEQNKQEEVQGSEVGGRRSEDSI
jgi:uncharacterized membrane protein